MAGADTNAAEGLDGAAGYVALPARPDRVVVVLTLRAATAALERQDNVLAGAFERGIDEGLTRRTRRLCGHGKRREAIGEAPHLLLVAADGFGMTGDIARRRRRTVLGRGSTHCHHTLQDVDSK